MCVYMYAVTCILSFSRLLYFPSRPIYPQQQQQQTRKHKKPAQFAIAYHKVLHAYTKFNLVANIFALISSLASVIFPHFNSLFL